VGIIAQPTPVQPMPAGSMSARLFRGFDNYKGNVNYKVGSNKSQPL
jgi:hypothetical protein